MDAVVSELEGTLLKDRDPFSYFMLVAFEASGLLRFALLLIFWPVIWLLEMLGMGEYGLKLVVFVATAGEHLRADEVIGSELVISRFGFATGFVKGNTIDSYISSRVAKLFIDEKPGLGLGTITSSFLSLCKEQIHPPFMANQNQYDHQLVRPLPVIFHDGRLVKRPTPSTALLIILWMPLGIILATIRILVGLMLPMWAKPYLSRIVPVAMNYRVGFFHATTARGCKALDPIFFFMNPRPVYEVTFLNQLPVEATCSSGKSPHDVANYVQRILAATLGFECTNFTRKDKYRVLAGNDGTVSYTSFVDQIKKEAIHNRMKRWNNFDAYEKFPAVLKVILVW
ncbi:hypothetical protein D5086_020637 [Populus alba]|uniref:Uncharacterized protein n=1 Tax=Populus alba TaxID=43335 RepID=A0ACC4BKK7_POPAL